MCNFSLWKFSLLLAILALVLQVNGMNKMPAPEIKAYSSFGRECTRNNLNSSDSECNFSIPGSGTLYFKCKNGTQDKGKKFCFCTMGDAPSDELTFPLEWDSLSESCLVGKGGPCGTSKGLSVGCRKDLSCLNGRCRRASEMRTGKANQFCNDELDCENGLQCRDSLTPTVVKIKRCY